MAKTIVTDSNIQIILRRNGRFYILLLSFMFCILFTSNYCYSEDSTTIITSDNLDYFSDTKKVFAKGQVHITKDDAVIGADEVIYYEDEDRAYAEGNVNYYDSAASIKADRADLNLKDRTGRLYNAQILIREYNYHITGEIIEKKSDKYYYSPKALFTTCDALIPAWCFKGKEINLEIGRSLRARDASFNIKNLPVLYTPYLWAPVVTERQTGFLLPVVSSSKTRGFGLSLPFFWAISEDRDATIIFDAYTKRGIGTGIEYRFVRPKGVKSSWWAYYLHDIELKKDFFELRALYENRSTNGPGVFLNMNIVNRKEFYREFSPHLQIRTQRFLESTAEFNVPVVDSRLYLLAQYWVDLKYSTGNAPQRLPEAGYVLNYTKKGPFLLSGIVTASHIWRKDGISAERLDIYPKVLHSIGKDIVFTQTLGLRGTAYSFYKNEGLDDAMQRTGLEYTAVGRLRLYKKYSSFMHVMEPTIRYVFISVSENNLPVFDSTELFKKRSMFEFSLLNRIISKGSELVTIRLTQPIDTYNGDRPFLPLLLELSAREPLPVTLQAGYNPNTGKTETVSSELGFKVKKANIKIGQRYNLIEDANLFTASIEFNPKKELQFHGSMWYDAKGGGLRDIALRMRYLFQCWGIKIEAVKKPGDFTFMIMFELLGFGSKPSGRS